MQVNDWKRIAEREAKRYRENKAFMRGVMDAGASDSPRYRQKMKWVTAVDCVLAYLKQTDAEKERFFRLCYGIDGTRMRLGEKAMVAMSFEFHVSITTMYRWRSEQASLLVIAAAQTGALRPYGTEPER